MISKKFVKSKSRLVCRVTFSLPETIWADSIHLVGDFNDWDNAAHPLHQGPSGQWSITLDLEAGPAYQFRYLCDGEWMNDNQADAYWENPHGAHNSVIFTAPDSAPDPA
jgi:1,4-alpha-glucan branching enzyme